MLIRICLLSSFTLLGQTPNGSGGWVPSSGSSPTGAVLGGPSAPSGNPSLLVSADRTDLGPVDSGTPIQGVLTLFNAGSKSFHLLPPAPGASPLKVVYPTDLELRAGAYTLVPFEFDAHGVTGPTTFRVQVATDDPGAPSLGVDFTCQVGSATQASPLRDSVIGKGQGAAFTTTQATFAFKPGEGLDPFEEVWIQDSSAPLRINVIEKLDNGTLSCAVCIDPSKITRQSKPLGETRILAATRAGLKNFVTLQWVLGE